MDPKLEFQTPPPVCHLMAGLIPPSTKTIMEPTPGIGNLVAAARIGGFEVEAVPDFFTRDKSKRYDCIIMNPPFSDRHGNLENAPLDFQETGLKLGYYILTECMKQSDHIIALMPWFTITDSDRRIRQLEEFGIAKLISLPRKTFNYTRIQTLVIELHRRHKGPAEFSRFEF